MVRSDDGVPDPLENNRKAVFELWTKFSHVFPSDGVAVQSPDSIPTITTLYEAINHAQTTWHDRQNEGFGPVKGRFLTFAETMNDYSYLFSVIPSGDKYISLVTGVVSSVVKVWYFPK